VCCRKEESSNNKRCEDIHRRLLSRRRIPSLNSVLMPLGVYTHAVRSLLGSLAIVQRDLARAVRLQISNRTGLETCCAL